MDRISKLKQPELLTNRLWNWEPKSKQAEISFELLEAWQGQGYMQEALHRVLDYAFGEMELHRLKAQAIQ